MSPSHCEKSPDGRHCYHGHSGPYWSTNAPSPVCCWCGKPESAEHGPHRPRHRPVEPQWAPLKKWAQDNPLLGPRPVRRIDVLEPRPKYDIRCGR